MRQDHKKSVESEKLVNFEFHVNIYENLPKFASQRRRQKGCIQVPDSGKWFTSTCGHVHVELSKKPRRLSNLYLGLKC